MKMKNHIASFLFLLALLSPRVSTASQKLYSPKGEFELQISEAFEITKLNAYFVCVAPSKDGLFTEAKTETLDPQIEIQDSTRRLSIDLEKSKSISYEKNAFNHLEYCRIEFLVHYSLPDLEDQVFWSRIPLISSSGKDFGIPNEDNEANDLRWVDLEDFSNSKKVSEYLKDVIFPSYELKYIPGEGLNLVRTETQEAN